MTKEELLAAVRSCAEKLGRAPAFPEFYQMTKIKRYWFKKHFRGQAHAFREAGIEPVGSGFRIKTLTILLDWAAVVRQLKKIPSSAEYDSLGRFSSRTLAKRCGIWDSLPEFFQTSTKKYGKSNDWPDVLQMIQAYLALTGTEPSVANGVMPVEEPHFRRRRIHYDRPLYGAPLPLPSLAYEPTNEAGVIYLFGMLAGKLRMQVQRMQVEFPDCEAMREVEAGKWQRVRIEFEFESLNFLKHKHRADGCDLIVCWVHNWPECPEKLEVIELRKIVREGIKEYGVAVASEPARFPDSIVARGAVQRQREGPPAMKDHRYC